MDVDEDPGSEMRRHDTYCGRQGSTVSPINGARRVSSLGSTSACPGDCRILAWPAFDTDKRTMVVEVITGLAKSMIFTILPVRG